MNSAWIGLGSNLGTACAQTAAEPPGASDAPLAQLQQALTSLEALPQTRCLRRSGFYRSAPVGPQNQPAFCNAVAQLQTALSPAVLLEHLLAIERRQGRVRKTRWGPRTLDLDLLLYDDLTMHTAALQLPHPRMHERAFVLRPLAELAPEVIIPGMGRVSDLLVSVAGQEVAPW